MITLLHNNNKTNVKIRYGIILINKYTLISHSLIHAQCASHTHTRIHAHIHTHTHTHSYSRTIEVNLLIRVEDNKHNLHELFHFHVVFRVLFQ